MYIRNLQIVFRQKKKYFMKAAKYLKKYIYIEFIVNFQNRIYITKFDITSSKLYLSIFYNFFTIKYITLSYPLFLKNLKINCWENFL